MAVSLPARAQRVTVLGLTPEELCNLRGSEQRLGSVELVCLRHLVILFLRGPRPLGRHVRFLPGRYERENLRAIARWGHLPRLSLTRQG